MTPEEIKASLKDVITTTIKGEDATEKLHNILQAKMQARINPDAAEVDIEEHAADLDED
jgi:hypothetical protein